MKMQTIIANYSCRIMFSIQRVFAFYHAGLFSVLGRLLFTVCWCFTLLRPNYFGCLYLTGCCAIWLFLDQNRCNLAWIVGRMIALYWHEEFAGWIDEERNKSFCYVIKSPTQNDSIWNPCKRVNFFLAVFTRVMVE